MKRIKDSEAADAALYAITENNVIDLYIDGSTSVKIPKGINPDEFAAECILLIQDLWGEPDVNFDYGEAEFLPEINGETLTITVE